MKENYKVNREPGFITSGGHLTPGTESYVPDPKVNEERRKKKEAEELKKKESLMFKNVIEEDNGEVKVRKSRVELTNQLLEKNSALAQALRAGDIKQAGIIKKEIVNIKQAIEELENIH